MNTAAQYTPGPWETDHADHDCPHQDISIRQAGVRHPHNICRIWIDDAPVPDYSREQEANARLIKSAPTLADALRNMVHWYAKREAMDRLAAEQSPQITAAIAALTDAGVMP